MVQQDVIINVIYKMKGKLEDSLNKLRKFGDATQSSLKTLTEGFDNAQESLQKLSGIAVGSNFLDITNKGDKLRKAMDKINKENKKFKPHWIGIIYFGRQLTATFKGLTSASLEMAGVFDVLNSFLGMAFLPLGMFLLDVVLWLWDAWDALPEPVQNFIDILVAVGLGIGIFLTVLGTLKAGLWALSQPLPKFSETMKDAMGWFGFFAIAAIIALAIIKGGWKNFQVAIQASQLATQAMMRRDWDAYTDYVLLRNINLKWGIIRGFASIYNEVKIILWQIGLAFTQTVLDIMTSLNAPEWMLKPVRKFITEYQDRMGKAIAETGQVMEYSWQMSIEEAIKSGMSLTRIIVAMPNDIKTINDAWFAVKGTSTQTTYQWMEARAAAEKIMNPIQNINTGLVDINDLQKDIQDETNNMNYLFDQTNSTLGDTVGQMKSIDSQLAELNAQIGATGQSLANVFGMTREGIMTKSEWVKAQAAKGGYISPTLQKYLGMQHGGLVTKPTPALIGERGPEAVIPLDRIGSIGGINITINTSTIGGNTDQIAREIAEKFSFELSRVRY